MWLQHNKNQSKIVIAIHTKSELYEIYLDQRERIIVEACMRKYSILLIYMLWIRILEYKVDDHFFQ